MFDDAVILDVGTHIGHTLEELVKPQYLFRTIYAFEPMIREWTQASETYGNDPRLTIFNYGLGDHTGPTPLYGGNDGFETSIYADKNDADENVVTICDIVSASEFFQEYLSADDMNIVKLNCEGSEVPILNNLIDSGMIHRIYNVMIDWDARKVPSVAHCEGELIARMASIGFDRYSLCDNVMVGVTHQNRIANWLNTIA